MLLFQADTQICELFHLLKFIFVKIFLSCILMICMHLYVCTDASVLQIYFKKCKGVEFKSEKKNRIVSWSDLDMDTWKGIFPSFWGASRMVVWVLHPKSAPPKAPKLICTLEKLFPFSFWRNIFIFLFLTNFFSLQFQVLFGFLLLQSFSTTVTSIGYEGSEHLRKSMQVLVNSSDSERKRDRYWL